LGDGLPKTRGASVLITCRSLPLPPVPFDTFCNENARTTTSPTLSLFMAAADLLIAPLSCSRRWTFSYRSLAMLKYRSHLGYRLNITRCCACHARFCAHTAFMRHAYARFNARAYCVVALFATRPPHHRLTLPRTRCAPAPTFATPRLVFYLPTRAALRLPPACRSRGAHCPRTRSCL